MKVFSSEAESSPFAPEQGNACVGSVTSRKTALLLALFAVGGVDAWEDTCTSFKDIYTDGKDLCETMFADAFVYETDESKAFSMWWFGGTPNADAANNLNLTLPDTCNLQYHHKGAPGPEGDEFTECLPWKENACCDHETVKDTATINAGYGPGYEWDRCGPMSQACERFFVQEACLYECDPYAGHYRLCSDAQVEAAMDDENDPCHYNTWQMYKMPIKASYCDAWYDACKNDRFCGGGDYFECNSLYWEDKAAAEAAEALATEEAANATAKALADAEAQVKQSLPVGAVVAIVVSVVVVLVAIILYIIKREKQGSPLFVNLAVHADDKDPINQ